MELLLTDELGQALIGALYTICRADGAVTEAEVDALHAEAAALGVAIDDQTLFFTEVTPESLADTLRGAGGGPFREAAISPAPAISAAFLSAADRIATLEGENESASRHVAHYRRVLSTLR